MSIQGPPPEDSAFSVHPGDSGWYPFAIQVGLNSLGAELAPDGSYGPVTTKAVTDFQKKYGLYQDGIAGPATQPKIVSLVGAAVEAKSDWLARGYVRGISQAEASGMISAVNWAVSGGVDCGPVQRRVLGPPFPASNIAAAFDSAHQFALIASGWRSRRDAFLGGFYAWTAGNRGRAGRCAALAHNWPAGAEAMAKNGAVPTPRQRATWIPRDFDGISLVHFPDGTLVDTYGQWAAFYALGGPHGEGLVARYVTDWR